MSLRVNSNYENNNFEVTVIYKVVKVHCSAKKILVDIDAYNKAQLSFNFFDKSKTRSYRNNSTILSRLNKISQNRKCNINISHTKLHHHYGVRRRYYPGILE